MKISENGKIKRLRFDLAEILKEKKSNAKFFCVKISTPPFQLDLWGKRF